MDSDKITIMMGQLKEMQSTINGLQSLVSNGDIAISKEIAELRQEQKLIQQKLDKLIGNVQLVNEDKKLKTSYKDYSAKEVYELRQRTSNNKAAKILGCSVSTVRNRCREYQQQLLDMEVDF
jgi:response regulator of citrate/malate metabolism